MTNSIQSAYELAKERYAALGVDTEQALTMLSKISISLHCWQGDDVGGFESPGGELSGGIATRGAGYALQMVVEMLDDLLDLKGVIAGDEDAGQHR